MPPQSLNPRYAPVSSWERIYSEGSANDRNRGYERTAQHKARKQHWRPHPWR